MDQGELLLLVPVVPVLAWWVRYDASKLVPLCDAAFLASCKVPYTLIRTVSGDLLVISFVDITNVTGIHPAT
jgi:hypothetical protein